MSGKKSLENEVIVSVSEKPAKIFTPAIWTVIILQYCVGALWYDATYGDTSKEYADALESASLDIELYIIFATLILLPACIISWLRNHRYKAKAASVFYIKILIIYFLPLMVISASYMGIIKHVRLG